MSLTRVSTRPRCLFCSRDVTSGPIDRSVGRGGVNVKADVLMIQQLLNSVRPEDGGPGLLLAEDGIIGPKTQAAIDKYQHKVLLHTDGRIDSNGPTIRAMTGFICDSSAVNAGPLGLIARPSQKAGAPPAPAKTTTPLAAQTVKDGKTILRLLEPKLRSLRFKLGHQFPPTVAYMNKHFATGKNKLTAGDITFIQKITARIHFHVERFNAFGIQPIDNVILFDSNDPKGVIGWTVRGGDKLSTKQFQIYADDNGKPYKAPGQSVFLTNIFESQPGFEKHWVVLHEMAHFVGPRDGAGSEIDDYAYAFDSKFLGMGRFFKVHNAETISLFLLEFCLGTANIVNLDRLSSHASHFNAFPKVTDTGEIVMS